MNADNLHVSRQHSVNAGLDCECNHDQLAGIVPAIFICHGSPMLALEDVAARDFLKTLWDLLPECPKAILVVSAHWARLRPALNAPAHNETIHDFGGFPAALYQLQYPAPPSADLARRAAELLAAAGLPADIDTKRGLDHDARVPLIVAWPDADIPVVQLSVQTRLGPEYHFRLGEALKSLRAEGVLIVGSGSFSHDLSSFPSSGGRLDAPEQDWVRVFAE